MKNRLNKNKRYIILVSCMIYLFVVTYFILVDGIFKKGTSGVSGFIEQDSLRKSLGDWYQLVFYTFHVNIYFLIVGILYGIYPRNKIIKNLFFSSATLIILCLCSLIVFSFKSFNYNPYEATKTLFVHGIIPISALLMLFWIKNEIVIDWRILWINSFYFTFYLMLSLIIYYNFKFTQDSPYPGQPLWIYAFLDYDHQIFFIKTSSNVFLKSFSIGILLTISPFAALGLFNINKNIYNIKSINTLKSTYLMKI